MHTESVDTYGVGYCDSLCQIYYLKKYDICIYFDIFWR